MNKILPILTGVAVMTHEQLDAYFAPLFGSERKKRPTTIDEVLERAKARREKPAWDPTL